MNSIGKRLASMGYDLPEPTPARGVYTPWIRSGDHVFFSGQVCKHGEKAAFLGKVGREFSLDEGRNAAKLAVLNVIAQIAMAAGDDITRVRQICRIGGLVNAAANFTEHSKVIDAASELVIELFGEAGHHARTAMGAGSLPRGVAVEIDAVVEIANDAA